MILQFLLELLETTEPIEGGVSPGSTNKKAYLDSQRTQRKNMNPMAIPKKYYDKEGFLSLMGIGYTAALAVTGLGFVNMVSKRDMSSVIIEEPIFR